jgi:hypothetical protein
MEKLRCPYCKAKLKYLLLPFHSSGAMNAATPNGAPQRISVTIPKTSLPAVSLRSTEVKVFRISYDFHGSGVDPIRSCLFVQTNISGTT